MKSHLVAALASAVALSACFGGGSGSGGNSSLATRLSGNAGAVQERIRAALPGLVSNTQISFGSVVAAAGADVTGIDTDFSGGRAKVTIQRRGKAAVNLDTANTYSDLGAAPSLVGAADRQSRSRYVFSSTANRATAALVAVDWQNNDPTDYLAGGYWVNIEANPDSLEFGAYVAGPELDINRPPTLRTAGTASYRGTAAGMYASEDRSEGSTEVGEFEAVATLTADFGADTISGCVGCEGGIDVAPGDGYAYSTNYRLQFGATPINRNQGTFQGSNVTLSNPDIPISSSSGVWAGQFSNRPSGSDPRLVAGAFAGQASTTDGSRGVFVGAFGAGKQ